jgi:hypothetical protein
VPEWTDPITAHFIKYDRKSCSIARSGRTGQAAGAKTRSCRNNCTVRSIDAFDTRKRLRVEASKVIDSSISCSA